MTPITIKEWKFSFTLKSEAKKQAKDGTEQEQILFTIPQQASLTQPTLWALISR